MEPKPMSRDHAAEVRNSVAWKWIDQELAYRIVCKIEHLRRCKPEELVLLQKEIALLEEFKRLPDDVADRESDSESAAP